MRKRIVMVMGVQRSGTTALFDALSHGRVTAFHENPGNYVYDNYYLRPEPELRSLFHEIPGAILLKPISETFRRSVREVFEEYAAYDLHVIWIYRDPVNSSHSMRALGFTEHSSTVPELAEQWVQRNRSALDALPFFASRMTIVSYQDLAEFPSTLAALGARVGIETAPDFRSDSGAGRRKMAPELQSLVDGITRETRARLDAARTILPDPASAPAGAHAAPDAPEAAFIRDPMGQLREARARDSVHPRSQPNTWVVLGYDDVAAILGDLERFSCVHYRAESRIAGGQNPSNHTRMRTLLEPHLGPGSMSLYALRVGRYTRRILAEFADGKEFDLVSAFAMNLTVALAAEWSGGGEPDNPITGIAVDPKFTPEEVSDLRRSIPIFGKGLTQFIANAMHYLLFHPELEAALRNRQADIAAFVDEMVRLFPPAFAAKRFTLCPVKIAGVNIPAEAHVQMVLFAANRDPARYQQPDEMVPRRAGPPHLSFSDGPHAWLVRRLGQLERETVLRILLAEFPPLRPVCQASEIRFKAPPEFYVPAALPVRFDA